MHELVSFNRQVVPASDAALSAISSAALYGRGIFTTIAVRKGRPVLWDRHWARLEDNAGRVGIDLSGFSEQAVMSSLTDLLGRNGTAEALARVTFFDGSGGSLGPFETGQKIGLLITTRYPRPVPERIRLTVSPYPINSASPLAGVKSCNYMENILALEEAKTRGFDEAMRLNERGEIAGGSMSNVFWEKDGRLFTPSLNSGCLPGTTRAHVIEKFGAEEMDAGVEEGLENADVIFLTSAGLGMVQVAEFNGKIFKAGGRSFGIDYR